MSEGDRDPNTIVRDIEQSREELSHAIDELADRLHPANAARRGIAHLKGEARQVAAMIKPPARRHDDELDTVEPARNGPPPAALAVGVGVALTVTVVTVLAIRRRRRRGRRRR